MAVATNVTVNDSPAANPIVGAKSVLIIDAKTTEKIFQYMRYIQKICIFATSNTPL
jgi:hypothetical protein